MMPRPSCRSRRGERRKARRDLPGDAGFKNQADRCERQADSADAEDEPDGGNQDWAAASD